MNRSSRTPERAREWVIFSCFQGGGLARPLLERAAARHGRRVRLIGPWRDWTDLGTVVRSLADAERVFIWNGEEPGCDWAKRVCDAHGVPWCIVELGLLPQAGHLHLDPSGIIGRSSLNGPLRWVEEADRERMRRHRDAWAARKGLARVGRESYAVVPLQLEFDTAAYLFSPFKTMQALVDAAGEFVPELPLVVCPHPVEPVPRVSHPRATIAPPGTSMQQALRGAVVIGANSTMLYETAAIGIPTVALADCPVRRHHGDLERLLAAAVARQIRADEDDPAEFDRWLESLERVDEPAPPQASAVAPARPANGRAPLAAAVAQR